MTFRSAIAMHRTATHLFFACACHAAHGFDLANHHKALLQDEDPQALVAQFVEADAQGLQTSSEDWPLVQRFTNWTDGPGWDFVLVAKSHAIGRATVAGEAATVPVTYHLVGTLSSIASTACPGGACNSLEQPKAKQLTVNYRLKKTDSTWVIEAPQSAPVVNAAFAYKHAMQNRSACLKGKCASDPVVRVLKRALP
jgi:hypothetical protein